MKSVPGRILLSDGRTIIEDEKGKYLDTLDHRLDGKPRNTSSQLIFFREDILRQKASLDFELNESCWLVILPVTGELSFVSADSNIRDIRLSPEEVLITNIGKASYAIRNDNEYPVHYLHFRIKIGMPEPANFTPSVLNFSFNRYSSKPLISLDNDGQFPFGLRIGNFNGRQEAIYKTKNGQSTLFAHILSGAFEIEGRLLEAGDGLLLWDVRDAEMEALSNHSVLVVLELF